MNKYGNISMTDTPPIIEPRLMPIFASVVKVDVATERLVQLEAALSLHSPLVDADDKVTGVPSIVTKERVLVFCCEEDGRVVITRVVLSVVDVSVDFGVVYDPNFDMYCNTTWGVISGT